MRVSLKQLKSLQVETVSGIKLGHVHELILELDGQLIAQYEVRASMIGGKVYLIGRDQIVRFEKDKLIVDDSVLAGEDDPGKEKVRIAPNPVTMRKES